MITAASTTFTFAALDDIAFAAERGRLGTGVLADGAYAADDLGPVLELAQLAATGLLPTPSRAAWLTFGELGELWRELSTGRLSWTCRSGHMGYWRLKPTMPDDPAEGASFRIEAHKAALAVGIPPGVAAQLVGAFGEMQGNVYDHSEASGTGIAAYRATARRFEFVVADRGVGSLASLRTCSEYVDLADDGEALRLTLTDGVSRYGARSGHGRGFRPLFTGLANLNGALRFRSGTGVLTLDGVNPSLVAAKLGVKPNARGFFAAVVCNLTNSRRTVPAAMPISLLRSSMASKRHTATL
jgi:hypothetical protein